MLSGTGTMDERKGLAYTRAYCEENIWKLCDARRGTDYDVVFVSNEQKSVRHACACSNGIAYIMN